MRWLVVVLLLAGWSNGRAIYDRHCAPCHGVTGDGLGPAAPYAWRQPRSFVRGLYKWRSTPVGQPPLVADIKNTILYGAPGTSMPGFMGVLSATDIDDVIDVLRGFAPAAFATPTRTITLGPPPPPDPARGAELWVKLCRACHGSGNSDGMSAFALSVKPYPFAQQPIHRPREHLGDVRDAIAHSIATGIAGTPMQSYAQYLSEAEIWAVADHVVEINRTAVPRGSAFDAEQIDPDRASPKPIGLWPGATDDELAVFGAPIALQGTPPVALAPAEASLAGEQCARCHAAQFRDWAPSVHRRAMSSGVRALIAQAAPADRPTCVRCHAPLPEQAGDDQLRDDGVSCAGCHVRGWTRYGPTTISPSLLPIPSYPKLGSPLFERADVCAACHQLPPREQVAGKPLENTYKEWLDGPYMRRGVQCQHCHMAAGAHAFNGIHDRQTVHEALAVTTSAQRDGDTISVTVDLRNAGAGHYLPTSATPAIVVTIELVDRAGHPIAGASTTARIGRDVVFDAGWHERSDTRIPPGDTRTIARAWSKGRTTEATTARITIDVWPDAFYERDFAERRARTHDPEQRALLDAALARARGSHYTVEQRAVTIHGV